MAQEIVLVEYDKAIAAIAKARTVPEVKDIHNKAIAWQSYARAAKNKSMLADAWEIRVVSTRRLGEMLKKGKDDRAPVGRQVNGIGGIPLLPSLREIGIDKSLARRARRLYNLTTKQFGIFVIDGRAAINDGIDQALKTIEINEERQRRYCAKHPTIALSDLGKITGEYSVVYADPPWTFKVYSGKGKQRSAERHYDTMDLEAIKKLPIGRLLAKDCVLFIWCVWPELPGALEVIKAWDFEYKTAGFVWFKKVSEENEALFTGMGYWTRANSEGCLLATRGKPMRLFADVPQVVHASIGAHSQKPEVVRERIRRLVGGPYLELFGRERVQGWTVWGNEL